MGAKLSGRQFGVLSPFALLCCGNGILYSFRCPEGADEVDPQDRERPFDDTCKPADAALPDVSASTQLLLDSVFTEAILPR